MTRIELDHADMVAGLQKTGEAILSTLTPHQADAAHMALGAASEAGELGDAVKRYAFYNKPVDRANVIEELGDLEFYMEGIRRLFDLTRAETLHANIMKLTKGTNPRYAGGVYSDQAAQDRADKAVADEVSGDGA